jgi:hypothetical protein
VHLARSHFSRFLRTSTILTFLILLQALIRNTIGKVIWKFAVQIVTPNFWIYFLREYVTTFQRTKSRVLRRLTRNYVISERTVEESSKVKMFDKFIDDLRALSNAS